MHPYKKEASAGHAKKVASFGGKSKGDHFNDTSTYDGVPLLDSGHVNQPQIRPTRKAGGRVGGEKSEARLDKSPRAKKQMGGAMMRPGMVGAPGVAPAMANPAMMQRAKGGKLIKKASGGSTSYGQDDDDLQNSGSTPSAADLPTTKSNGSSGRALPSSSMDQLKTYSGRMDTLPNRRRGGKVHPDEAEDKKLISKMIKSDDKRMGKASGGRVGKGKTTVNVIVSPQGGGQQSPQRVPVPVPVPQGPPPGAGAPPPMAGPPPGMGGPQMPPPGMMARKRGGRVGKNEGGAMMTEKYGSGSGLGRIEKKDRQESADKKYASSQNY